MVAPGGTPGPAVDQNALARLLDREPFSVEFFQAVRLLERLYPERQPVGRFANPSEEVVRFRAHLSLAFPASEIQALDRTARPTRLTVNFMGLTGPLGVLPRHYTQLAAERAQARDTALRDFFDLFNHRAISLFYQAWEKYKFTVAHERGQGDRFTHYLKDLIGLGTPGLEGRQAIRDESLVFYAGLLMLQCRSARVLEQILQDYYDAPVQIEEFVGAWYRLEPEVQCCLDERQNSSGELGLGAVVGDEVWSHESRARIRIGPLPLRRYREFLPTGSAYGTLRAWTMFFTGGQIEFEVQLVLQREEVPACDLSREGEDELPLGWCTWIKTAPMDRDPGDTVFLLGE